MTAPLEVLAPAGNWEALEAAVRAGAGAVYLAGKSFGARAKARNFSQEELAQAVRYCHQRGVRVHVTVNTLLKDSELAPALAFVDFLCSLPVDAVLVQDLGLLALLRRRAPALPIHASTQMSLHTPAGVRLAGELGAVRAVLARELSLPEIREIAQSTHMELETFVHGALCMCLSGQCLLSAMLGGQKGGARSGNRGQCAQPCRLPFAAAGGTGHDLSLKDLSYIQGLPRLQAAGVCSVKIEGRMKRPEYVAAATAACRLAAGGQPVPPALIQSLEAVFSRSGFTAGYLSGQRGRAMFGTRRKEDVAAATEKVLAGLRGLYRAERQSVPVRLTLSQGQGRALLTAEDCEGNSLQVDASLEPLHIDAGRAEQQLRKTGGTPFCAGDVHIPTDGVSLSVAGLNALRRRALEGLLALRGERQAIPFTSIPVVKSTPYQPSRQGEPLPLRACFASAAQLPPSLPMYQSVSLPIETPPQALARLQNRLAPGQALLLDLPRGLFGWEEELRALIRQRMEQGFRHFVCGNLGALQLCREVGATAHGSFGLNITNTAALEELARLGLQDAELSWELTGREIAGLGGSLRRGVMVYGRQALMLTRNCPLANASGGCRHCQSPGWLSDRKGKRFPVMCRAGGRGGAELLNSVPLWLGDEGPGLAADFGILRFTVENSVECGEISRRVQQGESPVGSYTRGLFRRGVL